ncbi:hypothetical protein Syun_007509 [Stephania yunnanensis]|uniref:Uncharacterized protein n=1 Tax=Stephania yunnanensis TaxID=152371 RepID=A0AAP0PYS6_9MAGN
MKSDLSQIGVDLEMIQNMVFGLEGKLEALESKQDITNLGLWYLCQYAEGIKDGFNSKTIQVISLIAQFYHETALMYRLVRQIEAQWSCYFMDSLSFGIHRGTKLSHSRPRLPSSGAPDLRGYGDTDALNSINNHTSLSINGDLVALIDALGEDQDMTGEHSMLNYNNSSGTRGSAIVPLPIADGESNFTNLSSKNSLSSNIQTGISYDNVASAPPEDLIPRSEVHVRYVSFRVEILYSTVDIRHALIAEECYQCALSARAI